MWKDFSFKACAWFWGLCILITEVEWRAVGDFLRSLLALLRQNGLFSWQNGSHRNNKKRDSLVYTALHLQAGTHAFIGLRLTSVYFPYPNVIMNGRLFLTTAGWSCFCCHSAAALKTLEGCTWSCLKKHYRSCFWWHVDPLCIYEWVGFWSWGKKNVYCQSLHQV